MINKLCGWSNILYRFKFKFKFKAFGGGDGACWSPETLEFKASQSRKAQFQSCNIKGKILWIRS